MSNHTNPAATHTAVLADATFNVFVQGPAGAEHVGEFDNFGEAHNFVTFELRTDFDLKTIREATLDEVDTAVAEFDIDGVFEAVFVARAFDAEKDDTIVIVRDLRG